MKECPKCHKQYEDNKNFCLVDGQKLVEVVAPQPAAHPKPAAPVPAPQPAAPAKPMKECPKCHKRYEMDRNFCLADGQKLVEVGAATQPAPKPIKEPKPVVPPVAPQPKPAAPAPTPQPVAQPKPAAPAPAPKPAPKPKKPVDPKKKARRKRWIITLVVLLLLAGGAVAAYFFIYNAASYLNATPGMVQTGKSGGTVKATVSYDGYMWSVADAPEWVETDKDGNELQISVAPNNSGTSRVGAIMLKSGNVTTRVEVSQSAYVTFITPSVSSLTFSRNGGTQTFAIKTDGGGASFECPDFVTAELRNDTVVVKASANNGNYRNGTLVVKEDNIRTTLMVEQTGACPICQGSGKVQCTNCNGTGRFTYGRTKVTCVGCSGTGQAACDECNGTGEIGAN